MAAGKKKNIRVISAAAAVAALLLVLVFSGRNTADHRNYECSTYAMGTYFQQSVTGNRAQAAAAEASRKIAELENRISWKIPGSDLAHLQREAGRGPVAIERGTASLLSLAAEIAKQSDGFYDPTVQPLSSLWDFDGDLKKVPSPEAVSKAAGLVGYSGLAVDLSAGTASLSRSGMGIDLGGIGKGAACDTAVQAYRDAGVSSALISAGGSSIGLWGTKPDGTPWRIAVRDPATPDSNTDAMGELQLTSGYLSTSGIYEKCFRQNGVLYHHLLNPKTGYPQNNGLVSVTVVADGGALSDGLSTACFVYGREKSAALLDHYHAGAVFIDGRDRVCVTKNLAGKFKITNSKYHLAES